MPELIQNVNRSSHGHSTPSLKISCKSVQPFSRNVADKEISIAASRGFSELTQNVMWSSRGLSTHAASLKISCKSVQPFCLDTKRHRRQTTDCTNGATDSTVGQKLRGRLMYSPSTLAVFVTGRWVCDDRFYGLVNRSNR